MRVGVQFNVMQKESVYMLKIEAMTFGQIILSIDLIFSICICAEMGST